MKFSVESVLDFDQLLYDLQSEYDIGFAGLFEVDEGTFLYVQRHEDASTRMALGKIKKICTKVAGEVEVVPFKTPEGQLIESVGEFRPMGAKVKRSSDAIQGTTQQVQCPDVTTPSTPPVSQFVERDTNKRTRRGLEKDEELLVLGGNAYACRKIPLPSNKSTFSAVYSSSCGTWSARFWVGPMESLGVKDKTRVGGDQKTVLLERQNSLCQECSCPVSIGSYSNADIDHIIPRHLGGKTVLDNLQIICTPCHRTKTGLESKAVRRMFPDLELELDDGRMYAVANDRPRNLRNGILIPLEYIRDPAGIVVMS